MQHFLKEHLSADKAVGKAAAALLVLGGIKKVYSDIISLSALTNGWYQFRILITSKEKW